MDPGPGEMAVNRGTNCALAGQAGGGGRGHWQFAPRHMNGSRGATAVAVTGVAAWKPSRVNGAMFTLQLTVTVTLVPWAMVAVAGNPLPPTVTVPPSHQPELDRSAWAACWARVSASPGVRPTDA